MYEVEFHHISEVRMGSPYNTAQIEVKRGYFPTLLKSRIGFFQDKAVISNGGNTLFLVIWETHQGDPFFKVLKVSDQERKVYASSKISGCCKSLAVINDEEIKLSIFRQPLNLVETLREFPILMFDDEVEFKERTVENSLDSWTTFDSPSTFSTWLTSLCTVVNEGLLIETKGSVTVELLKTHLDELLKSPLDEIIYFTSNPRGTQYQLTIKNNNSFNAGWARV